MDTKKPWQEYNKMTRSFKEKSHYSPWNHGALWPVTISSNAIGHSEVAIDNQVTRMWNEEKQNKGQGDTNFFGPPCQPAQVSHYVCISWVTPV